MDYYSVSSEDAIKIVQNTKCDRVVASTVYFNSDNYNIETIEKMEAVDLVSKASSVYYNNDEFVPYLDLSFRSDNKLVKLLFGN